MAQAIQKVCRFCGIDVSTQKRTKDTLGNYYCQPCYEKSRSSEPTADDVFTCPTCNGSFNRDGMDDSGVCKGCNASKLTASDSCGSCGASIGGEAAFCARCGAKQNGRLSADDEIDVTSIIAHLRRYAELNTALIKAPVAEQQYDEVRPQMIAAGAVHELAELDRLFAKAQADKASYISECEDLKNRLHGFDQNRVAMVRRLILENATVDESIKAGVRLDLFGVFGDPSTSPQSNNPSPSAQPSMRAVVPKKSAFMNGAFSSPTKRATKKSISPKPLIVGFLCLISAGALAGSANGVPAVFAFSVLLALGGVATMLSWCVIAIVRKLSGSGSPEDAAVPDVEPITETPQSETSRPFPVGLSIAVGVVLVGVVLLILAVRRFLTATPPSPDDINFVVVTFLVGIVLVVIGFVTWSGACPKCLLLYTSEIINSEHLGTHIETRNESRVARTYDARGGPAQTETRYEVAIPITVTTSRHTKRCKSCGHIWQTTSRSES